MTDEDTQKVWQRHELTDYEKRQEEIFKLVGLEREWAKEPPHDCCSPCSDTTCPWVHHVKLDD